MFRGAEQVEAWGFCAPRRLRTRALACLGLEDPDWSGAFERLAIKLAAETETVDSPVCHGEHSRR